MLESKTIFSLVQLLTFNIWIPTAARSDDWAATADLTTLRQHLLDYMSTCLSRGDFILSSGSAVLTSMGRYLHPQGALAIGRILLSQLPTDVQAVAGLTGADPIVSAVSVFCLWTPTDTGADYS